MSTIHPNPNDEEGNNLRNRSKNNIEKILSQQMIITNNQQQEKNDTIKYSHFEEVLDRINPFGAYQIFVSICIVFAQVEWGGNFSFINLVGSVEPNWKCDLAESNNSTGDGGNAVISTIIYAPTNESSCQFIRANCCAIQPIKDSTEFNSIVASLRLICEDGDKPETIQILQAISLMIGSIVGGHIGDKFGRQCLFYISQLGVCISSCLTIASTSWQFYAIFQSINGFLYGILEVESLTLAMEYTNDQYRMIPVACFVQHIASFLIGGIAHLTKDWQMFFVFLNLITSPIIMAFMLFHESPRWLVARGLFNEASHVLNDLADKRWNNTEVEFSAKNLSELPHEKMDRVVSFYDLFSRMRFAKQSLMQILSMITFSMIGICYFYVIRDFPFSSINIVCPMSIYFRQSLTITVRKFFLDFIKLVSEDFRGVENESDIYFGIFTILVLLDGLFCMIIPILVIFLDMYCEKFTRRFQFLLSLSLMGLCFGIVIVLVGIFNLDHLHLIVVIFVIIAGMLNGSLFWMNIVQVTTQRFPTVIRCIAFGCLHSLRHIGTIAGILIMQPLEESGTPIYNFIIPFVLILLTLFAGIFLQPETKGKALLDTLDELDYARAEMVLPKSLHKMAKMQFEIHKQMMEGKNNREEEY